MPPKKRKAEVSDDDDYDQLAGDEGVDNSFVPGQLSEPTTGYLCAYDLYGMIKKQQIDLNPEFQRDFVWPRSKQIGLILSLAQNFPIPPLYFSILRYENGGEYRSTLDGKQRLTTLYEFFEGHVPYTPEGSKAKFYYKTGFKGKGKVMDQTQREFFEKRHFTCVQYEKLSQVQERDMFQRVQLGMPLKEGEKLQSLFGEWASFVSELCHQYVDDDGGLHDSLSWDTSRGVGFQTIATVVAHLAEPDHITHKGYAKLVKFLTQADPPSENFRTAIHLVLSRFVTITNSKQFRYPFDIDHKVAPVEFQMICVLIYRMRNHKLSEMVEVIDQMRKDVRAQHVDVRNNSRVLGTLWEFCHQYGDGTPPGGEVIASGSRSNKRPRGSK